MFDFPSNAIAEPGLKGRTILAAGVGNCCAPIRYGPGSYDVAKRDWRDQGGRRESRGVSGEKAVRWRWRWRWRLWRRRRWRGRGDAIARRSWNRSPACYYATVPPSTVIHARIDDQHVRIPTKGVSPWSNGCSPDDDCPSCCSKGSWRCVRRPFSRGCYAIENNERFPIIRHGNSHLATSDMEISPT